MQDADRFAMRQQRQADVRAIGRRHMRTLGGMVSCHNDMHVPGAKSPAVLRSKRIVRQSAIFPDGHNLETFSRSIKHMYGATQFRKHFRSHSGHHCKCVFFFGATLQQFRHLGQIDSSIRTLGKFTHHVLVLQVQFLLCQGTLTHFRMQQSVGFHERCGVLPDLLFQQLLVTHLIIDVGAGSEPLHDGT